MYPLLCNLPGHLHVLYNALKGVSMGGHDYFLAKLRTMEVFLSSKELRRAFQAQCLTRFDHRNVSSNYNIVEVSWELDFLTGAMEPLIRS